MDAAAKIQTTRSMSLAAMVYGLIGGMGFMPASLRSASPRKSRKPVPMMVAASPEEIAAWNEKVRPRNTKRHLKRARPLRDNGQHPKFPKARVHKQAKHPLRN